MPDVGKRIREVREELAFGQAELARLAGLNHSTLWAIEAGRTTPRPATLRKIAAALGVPVQTFTTGAEKQKDAGPAPAP